MTVDTLKKSGYAHVNGLDMYYEIHGAGRPLVLLHGALSATGTSFGRVLAKLAETRQVISLEQQAHGHTADIDRPLTVRQMADDSVAALRQLGITQADFFGYSMGAAIALDIGVRYPEMVGKLVLASVTYTRAGLHPGLLEGIQDIQPEQMVGTPWHTEYVQIAPRPHDFPKLLAKNKAMDGDLAEWTADAIRNLRAPTLLIIGDSDIVRPEHAVEMFRLLGGGVMGEMGMPKSQLAVLPGTSHSGLPSRPDLLLPVLLPFLD